MMEKIAITKKTTLRIFYLADIVDKRFTDFISEHKQTIIEEDARMLFAINSDEIIFYFDKKLFTDDVSMESALELQYYYTCYVNELFITPYTELKLKIEFGKGKEWSLLNEATSERIMDFKELKRVEKNLRDQTLQLA